MRLMPVALFAAAVVAAALVVVVAATSAAAADPTAVDPAAPASKPPRVSADVVTTSVSPAKITAAAGGEVTFTVRVDIAPTWHLYDHSYAHDAEAFYIGIDLVPGESADLAAYQAAFPPGKEGEFMGEKVSMLYDRVDIKVTAKLPDQAAGKVDLPLVLTAQACDSKICLQPSDILIAVTLHVE
ncbi:MAG: protein-disulfide reductase DsbD family protein [Candidatus Krumholzibacteria bacterium]|nr:protein-disulfide reductase DsbD family protein [Candidatus Krumholzibacteria bacterium]